MMPGRKFTNGGEYRYGFNGKEKDKDISEGDYDFGARIFDSRICRFFSRDPLWYQSPWSTPYSFADNNPIRLIDQDGKNPGDPTIFQEINELYGKLVLIYNESRNALVQSINTMRQTIDYPGKAEAIVEMENDLKESPPLSTFMKIKMWKSAQEMIFKHYDLDKYIEWASYLTLAGAFKNIIKNIAVKGFKKLMLKVEKLSVKEGEKLLTEVGENGFLKQTLKELKGSIKSLKDNVKEHEEKIANFLKDPKGGTDPKKLAEMMKDNPSEKVLMDRIMGRVKALEKQLNKNKEELKKAEQALEFKE